MLVFGDLATSERARAGLERAAARFRAAMEEPAGQARHANLVNAAIETARIAQGVVDAQFQRRGFDALDPPHLAALHALRAMARVIASSWSSGFAETGDLDIHAIAALIAHAPDEPVQARVAEGFAFYALYPEACLEAAPDADGCAVVIGVRSIGMALAPLLAERLRADLCLTLRPKGPPFQRECALAPDLAALLRTRRHARFCVIDEGPGLSGSSFCSIASTLESLGVARERIVFVHSNPGGPGAAASGEHIARWRSAPKTLLESGPATTRALQGFRVLRDLSGGAWREQHAHANAPANRPYERMKMLAADSRGEWLVKFNGLGDIGERKARMAKALADAGFTPPVGAQAHGFLAQRWLANARGVDRVARATLIARIGDYIAFRAANLPAPPTGGASVEALYEMARFNISSSLGEETAAALGHYEPRLDALARTERPVATDNRMHCWEWLCEQSGLILKCDAVDHCAAHDLVGCRDAAWDVAGAIVEFDLDERESATLIARVERHGVEIALPLLAFFLAAYCAFQLGAAAMAADANACWPPEAARWRAQRERYAKAARAFLLREPLDAA